MNSDRYLGFAVFLLLFLFPGPGSGQISSPGLGRINDALWMAAGFRQDIDSTGNTRSMTFIGNGRTSQPNNYNPVQRNFIWVINQEFTFRCKKHFQPSAAISFRRQNEYSNELPYPSKDPSYRYEVRLYGRLGIQSRSKGPLNGGLTLRQELRLFYTPDWRPFEENVQLRSRIRAQGIYTFSAQHRMTFSAEELFASSHSALSANWSRLTYTESRFCISYSFSPAKSPFTWSIGYMNNLIGQTHVVDAHILMMDITWKNIFGRKMKK